jgi:phosphate transport system protein
MQSFFEEELGKLRKRIIKMFILVNSQLEKSFQFVSSQEFETTDIATKNESRIDKLDIKIDKLCQRIFALAQPVATDLRFIMSSLRIGNEIERIGDIALDIIGRSETVRPYQETLEQYKLSFLFREVMKLINQSAEAYTNNNNELAKEIVIACKSTAETCNSVFHEIISQMTIKSDVIIIATDLILIIRDLERITNHLENIAESVVFIVEGKRIRHAGKQSGPNHPADV